MYQRILLTDDGSSVSAAAIPDAGALARIFKAEVIVLRVSPLAGEAPEAIGSDAWQRVINTDPTSAVVSDLDPPFGDIFGQLTSHGAETIGSLVVRGDPSSAIATAAKRLDANLLVMASHGHSGWKRAILGSVADRVS
ncbi:MAG: universal stress protein [Chloroflexi bacterium]|nr:universal stress protein [Chloroflexota bacterium]